MKKLEWLVRTAVQPSSSDSDWSTSEERDFIKKIDELISEPTKVQHFTMEDYHKVLSAAIYVIPETRESEVASIIKIVSVVKFGATLTEKPEDIIAAFKLKQTLEKEAALRSSRLLENILDELWTGPKCHVARMLLEKSFNTNVEASVITKACKAIRDFENANIAYNKSTEETRLTSITKTIN